MFVLPPHMNKKEASILTNMLPCLILSGLAYTATVDMTLGTLPHSQHNRDFSGKRSTFSTGRRQLHHRFSQDSSENMDTMIAPSTRRNSRLCQHPCAGWNVCVGDRSAPFNALQHASEFNSLWPTEGACLLLGGRLMHILREIKDEWKKHESKRLWKIDQDTYPQRRNFKKQLDEHPRPKWMCRIAYIQHGVVGFARIFVHAIFPG